MLSRSSRWQSTTSLLQASTKTADSTTRNDLWKEISSLEKEAITILASADVNDIDKKNEAYKLLAKSLLLKKDDPFMALAESYSDATIKKNDLEAEKLLVEMENAGLPPHISNIAEKAMLIPTKTKPITSTSTSNSSSSSSSSTSMDSNSNSDIILEGEVVADDNDGRDPLSDDDIDLSSTFSDTVTEKIRVKVNSFYDAEKSDPEQGKFMFWYKVAIYNEGPEPVQIVARMWEIEKVGGTKETVRGAGIMSTQPIIPAGDMFTYQSVCPLKVFPPVGKRVLGSMSGVYTICKGNMGQVNFNVKVGKFNLILPEPVNILSTEAPKE